MLWQRGAPLWGLGDLTGSLCFRLTLEMVLGLCSSTSRGVGWGQYEKNMGEGSLCLHGMPVRAWGWWLRSARVCAPQPTTKHCGFLAGCVLLFVREWDGAE